MVFEYALPWWAFLLLIAAAALAAATFYTRSAVPLTVGQRITLTGIRFSTLLILALFLLRPMILERPPGARHAVVAVLVDASRSMRLADADGVPRIERARELVERAILPALSREFQPELLTFGETLAPADPKRVQANGRWSDFGGALTAVAERYRGRNLAGVVIISDGGDTSGHDAAASVDRSAPPVFAVGVGSRQIACDREVLSVTAGQAALAESVIEIGATVIGHGCTAHEPIELRVLENGRPIQVRRVNASTEGSPLRETFSVSPRAGSATLYTVEIPKDPRELVPENNTRSVLVRPPGPRRRVLLVEGAPGYEHSFLKRALMQDSGLEIDSVVRKGQNDRGEDTFYVQGAPTRTSALARGYPNDREALFAYDAIVLGNVEADTLKRDQLSMTADFVSIRGGGLLVLGAWSFAGRGLSGTPLEEVLPVELTGRGGLMRVAATEPGEANRLTATSEGAGHPIMQLAASPSETRDRWAALPALAAVVPLGGPRPGASILAVSAGPGGAQPVIAVQQFGRGRAIVFAGEASWRWKMRVPSNDRTYETFWRQAIRWLATSSPAQVTISPTGGAMVGEPMKLDINVRDARFEPVGDASVRVRVSGPGGAIQDAATTISKAASGGYQASVKPDQPGVYRVAVEAHRRDQRLAETEAWVLVGGADAELSDPRLNDEVLRRLATATGGKVLAEGDLSALPALLRESEVNPVPPIRRDLWHNPWAFLILTMLLCSEWVLRRRWGLR